MKLFDNAQYLELSILPYLMEFYYFLLQCSSYAGFDAANFTYTDSFYV